MGQERSVGGAIENETSKNLDVASLVVAYLRQIGVDYVFGIPGGAIEPFYDALARSERAGGPRAVVARHESGAAFMADGYARETGKIGVCCATSGPGATNLITGIACAYDNNIPLLAITGQPALPSFGKGAFQESACTGVDTVGMFRHCTRYNTLVSHPKQLENKLVHALSRAVQAPQGPVHLSIPVDILRSPTGTLAPAFDLNSLMHRPSLLDEANVRELHALLKAARKIVFIIGNGAGEAIEAVLELAEITGARFVTTPDGKGLVNPRHTSYRGVFGFAGHRTADAALRDDPDIILAIGTHLGEWTSAGWSSALLNNRLVHIDASDDHLARTPMSRLHVRGRIRAICHRLIELLRAEPGPRPAPTARAEARDANAALDASDKFTSEASPIKPQRLMRELSRRCPPTVRFFADTGNSTAWAVHYLMPQDRRNGGRQAAGSGRRHATNAGWLRVIMDFAAMGWGIGAAVGAARGNPKCPVVCITGDGSYLMNGQEISVALVEQLSVVFVVLNDAALGMVMHGQRLAGAERIGFALPLVDYRRIAEAMGIPGHVIGSPADLDALDFDAILARKGPTLLDVRVDRDEVPPMNVRMKVLATATGDE